MADEIKMNMKALKRVDPYIETIEDSASQVALYKYATSEWEKLEIEGALFVNRREDDPKYGFIILNRLSDQNLIEPVTKELDVQLYSPFLLYKNKEGSIFGIWFYNREECERIFEKMQNCVKIVEKRLSNKEPIKKDESDIIALLQKASMSDSEAKKAKSATSASIHSGKKSDSKSQGRDPILRLLSSNDNGLKTSEKPRQSPSFKQNGEDHTKQKPEKKEAERKESPKETTDSVADFFAKASKTASAFSTPMLTSSTASRVDPAASFSPGGPPILHHPGLASTMYPVAAGPVQLIGPPGFHGMTHPIHVPLALQQTWPPAVQPENHVAPQRASIEEKPENGKKPDNSALQRLCSIPGSYSVEYIERSQREGSGSSTPHFQPISGSTSVQSKPLLTSAIKDKKPELMSPMAFSQQSGKKVKTKNEPTVNGILPTLNEEQLVQAIKHLFTTDPGFVTKLHKAYLESVKLQ